MAEEQVETTSCPYCKEEVRADAVVCKHCRSRLGAARPEHGGVCPYCKEDINLEATRCKHCGSDLDARAAAEYLRDLPHDVARDLPHDVAKRDLPHDVAKG